MHRGLQAKCTGGEGIECADMGHKQIGAEDWVVIAKMLRGGHSGSEIARTIGKDASAVNRHIAENGGREGYDAREVRRERRMKRIKCSKDINHQNKYQEY